MGNCIKNCIFNAFKMLFHEVSSVLESSATCCCPPSSPFRNFTLWYRIVKIWEVGMWAPPSELCGHTPASHRPLHWPFPRAALTLCVGFLISSLTDPLKCTVIIPVWRGHELLMKVHEAVDWFPKGKTTHNYTFFPHRTSGISQASWVICLSLA